MNASTEDDQKAIAQSLRLRGAPPPITRVSRKALIITGAVLSAGLAGAIAWSLAEHPRKAPAAPEAGPAAPPPETITSLPKDYLHRGDVPVLGPPLPGDLGRPILKAQARGAGVEPSEALVGPGAPEAAAVPSPRSVGGEQEARRQVLAMARGSALFLAAQASRRSEPVAADTKASSVEDARTISPERLQAPASPYVLQAGAIISAALVTGLRSDAAGTALAQVTQDVFDSLGGGHRLIPAGARLVGQYDTTTIAGQSRLGVVWTRLILPSGRSIVLDKLPAADAAGMAGLTDRVDRHWDRVWAAAGVSTVLAIGAEAGTSDDDDLVRALRRGTSQTASDVGQQIVGKNLALTPTLTIRPGAPLRVVLTRDLVLEPYDDRSRP